MNECRYRLRLMRSIDDEHDRDSERPRQIRLRAIPPLGPIEEAHDAFDDDEVGIVLLGDKKRVDQGTAHAPRVEIDARTACRHLMEARVDVVGTNLRRDNPKPGVLEGAQKGERDESLAAT